MTTSIRELADSLPGMAFDETVLKDAEEMQRRSEAIAEAWGHAGVIPEPEADLQRIHEQQISRVVDQLGHDALLAS